MARDNASGTFRQVGDSADRAGKQAESGLNRVSGAAKALGGFIAAAGIVQGFEALYSAAAESQKIAARTQNVIESMGNTAGVSAEQVGDLAGAIAAKTGIDDEAIQSGQNLILTFGNIKDAAGEGNDIFTRTSEIMVDMSAAMGTDASSSAIQLGKALNDPIKGITSLSRAGVSFTEEQKNTIRTMVETGDVMGAQQIILGELERQFGGAAEAMATPMDRAKVAVGNVAEQIGSYLVPAVDAAATWLIEDFLPAAEDTGGYLRDNFGPALGVVVDGVGFLVDVGGDLVGFFTDLPGPVQLGVTALAGFALLKNPVSSALETISLKALYAKDAIGSAATGGLRGAAGGLIGAFGGPWGLALAGATTALGFLIPALTGSSEEAKEAEEAQRGLADSIRATGGAIDETVRTQAAMAAETEGLISQAELWGVASSDVVDAILGNEDALGRVTSAANAYEAAQRGASISTIGATDAEGLAVLSSEQRLAALGALVGTVDGAVLSEAQLAAAVLGTDGATADASDTTGTYAAQLEAARTAADEVKQATDDYKFALDNLTGANITLDEATANYYTSLDQARESLGELSGEVVANNGLLDLSNERGREVRDRLVEQAGAANDLIATMQAQGRTTEDVAAEDARMRDAFYQTALQMSGNDETARLLTDRYYGIPGRINTDVTATVNLAQAALDGFITSNAGRRIELGVGVQGGGVQAAARIAAALGHADGGPIFGPGTGTSDSIPAWLSNGEYVVKAASVSKYGTDFLDAINSGRIGQFAGGGYISPTPVRKWPVEVTANTGPVQAEFDQMFASITKAIAEQAGTPGSGSIGGGWQSIWNWIKSRVPQARINSTYRPGDPGYHGRGKAVDLGYGSGPGGAGSAGLALIERTLFDGLGSSLAELIYDGVGNNRPDIKNGRPHTYSASTQRDHDNHVHAAVYGQGTNYVPADGPAYLHRGEQVVPQGAAYQAPQFDVRVFIGDRELTDIVRVEAEAVTVGVLTGATDRGSYSP